MTTSNSERIGKSLELLNNGLRPFVERELAAHYGKDWHKRFAGSADKALDIWSQKGGKNPDVHVTLALLADRYHEVFKTKLSREHLNVVSELRATRNKWAHQEPFSTEDTYRALDNMHRLLTGVSAEEAVEVDRQLQEILRARFEEQAKKEVKQSVVTAVQGQPQGGLKPWREVITPHKDVAAGEYQKAEFAADLAQVMRGEGSDEYRDPSEFFRRTYLTEGLKILLTGALKRLSDKGGDPVVQLQTNFGGGKTHSMLALYHLFGGAKAGELIGVEDLLKDAGLSTLPIVKRAVLVGTALSPAMTHVKPDGTEVRTLWGEMAWQLGGKKAYSMLEAADKSGVSPGSDVLCKVFKEFGPALILIDEWVAYVRMTYGEQTHLPAGSFEANMTFAQSLTEAVKATPRTMVVASIPSSDIETGGEGGKAALIRIMNTFGRLESSWRPATSEESFEIVRRRLFEEIPANLRPARDAVVKAFMDLYRAQPKEFPEYVGGLGGNNYGERLRASYPIHPELFDRLYNDWSTLERFQRTRGVLRLMAAVIRELWERHDGNLLILPSTIPMDAQNVQFELTRYLDNNWPPVIEKDVDGPRSLPIAIDRENPSTLGRYSAARRVARSIYMGSAPVGKAAHKGLDEKQVKLACTQPGESVSTFGDALRRIAEQSTHLYVDGQRFWYDTQPTVAKLARDRAAGYTPDDLVEEVRRRIREASAHKGDFARVHACPESTGDVGDEMEARLVILNPSECHNNKEPETAATKAARNFLDKKGTSNRQFRNALVFLAPEGSKIAELYQACATYLAWKSVENEKVALDLTPFQVKQVEASRLKADETVDVRIPEVYQWLLVPRQEKGSQTVEMQAVRLQGLDPLAVRASKKLRGEEHLIANFAPSRLRMELDGVPLWRGHHVRLKQLAEDFAQYLYLPRLRDTEVLLNCVKAGLVSFNWQEEAFAYAEGFDEKTGRYKGLVAGNQAVNVSTEGGTLLVKPAIALAQSPALEIAAPPPAPKPPGDDAAKITRFHGTVELNALKISGDAGKIAQEVLQHLTSILGSDVKVTLEIEAEVPSGVPENTVRTVSENCRTLKFSSSGFEKE